MHLLVYIRHHGCVLAAFCVKQKRQRHRQEAVQLLKFYNVMIKRGVLTSSEALPACTPRCTLLPSAEHAMLFVEKKVQSMYDILYSVSEYLVYFIIAIVIFC